MSKIDIQVGDRVRFWYESLHQQVFNWGIIISLDESTADIDNGNDKYIFTVPVSHIIQRNKRPEEIKAELEKENKKEYVPQAGSGIYTLKGAKLKDRETGTYLEESSPVNLAVVDVSFKEAKSLPTIENEVENSTNEESKETAKEESKDSYRSELRHRYR